MSSREDHMNKLLNSTTKVVLKKLSNDVMKQFSNGGEDVENVSPSESSDSNSDFGLDVHFKIKRPKRNIKSSLQSYTPLHPQNCGNEDRSILYQGKVYKFKTLPKLPSKCPKFNLPRRLGALIPGVSTPSSLNTNSIIRYFPLK